MPVDIGTLTEAFESAVATTNSSMLAVLVVLVILMVMVFAGVSWLFFRNQDSRDRTSGGAITALAETVSDTARAQREAAASQTALVEQLGAMVAAVRDNTEADIKRMVELRAGIERMAESGERQVSMLADLRVDFQGVSGLGAKIDAIQKTIEGMKINIETLLSEAGNTAIGAALARIEGQINMLAREMSETRGEINTALALAARTGARDGAVDENARTGAVDEKRDGR